MKELLNNIKFIVTSIIAIIGGISFIVTATIKGNDFINEIKALQQFRDSANIVFHEMNDTCESKYVSKVKFYQYKHESENRFVQKKIK